MMFAGDQQPTARPNDDGLKEGSKSISPTVKGHPDDKDDQTSRADRSRVRLGFDWAILARKTSGGGA